MVDSDYLLEDGFDRAFCFRILVTTLSTSSALTMNTYRLSASGSTENQIEPPTRDAARRLALLMPTMMILSVFNIHLK